ncbi:predicted protein [Postia placenta Mad-698-R]|nr:predicted protein [Postia placenta Mad-698-R]
MSKVIDSDLTPRPVKRRQPRFEYLPTADKLPCYTSVQFDPEIPLEGKYTLQEALSTMKGEFPRSWSDKAMSSTKELNKTEKNLSEEQQLRKLVYLPDLVDSILPLAVDFLKNYEMHLQSGKDFYNFLRVHVAVKRKELAKLIWSEKEIEKYADNLLLDRALAALRAILAQMTQKDWYHYDEKDLEANFGNSRPSLPGASYSDIFQRIIGDPDFPYLSSSVGKVLPDRVLISGHTSQDGLLKPTIALTIEVKAPAAMKDDKRHKHIFSEIQDLPSGLVPRGTATEFIYPEDPDTTDGQTRILVQVWTQMINKDSRLGILSSVEDTFFLARDKDTLYLSQSYELDKAPQLRVFAWFAVAVGLIEFDELRLPSPRTDWWKADPQHAVDVAGVNRRHRTAHQADYYRIEPSSAATKGMTNLRIYIAVAAAVEVATETACMQLIEERESAAMPRQMLDEAFLEQLNANMLALLTPRAWEMTKYQDA